MSDLPASDTTEQPVVPAHPAPRKRPPWFAIVFLCLFNLSCIWITGRCSVADQGDPPVSGFAGAQVHSLEQYGPFAGFASLLGATIDLAVPKKITYSNTGGVNALQAALTDLTINAAVDDFAANGFLAIRVPHAPPTYTTTIITPTQILYSYQKTDGGPVITSPVTITRRSEYEPQVNARYPITDGRSHWEVWWLRPGAPRPTLPFPFIVDTTYPGASASFKLDFPGSDARNCAGCTYDLLLFEGRNYIGPYQRTILLPDGPGIPATNPKVTWTNPTPCGTGVNFLAVIVPPAPVTVTQCLSNLDSVTRTFTITNSSLRGLNYQLYSLPPGGITPTLLAGNQITVGTGISNGMIIQAVLTGTAALPDSIRDTFSITATSKVSPTVTASIATSVFGFYYALNELVTQTITFNPIPNKLLTDPPFVITPTASSGLPVVLTVNGPCSLSGTTVTVTGVGSCTITASQPGNATFGAATPVSQTFTIAAKALKTVAIGAAYVNWAGP